MNIFGLITNWKWPGPRPTNYGWYHLMWLGIMIILCFVFSYFFARKHNEKIDNRVVFGFGLFLILIELYKQIFVTIDDGRYEWYAFPFQFCSVPMYIAIIAPFIKNKKIQDAMFKFLGLFALLAGVAVMLYPGSCFSTDYVTILIHTMMWHASMVILGVYLIVAKDYCKDIKDIFKEVIPGTIIFGCLVLFALVVNIVGYYAWFGTDKNTTGQKLFFLYLSPWYENPFPILGTMKEKVPFPVFLLAYLAAFAIGITILWFAIFGIKKLVSLFKNKKNANA